MGKAKAERQYRKTSERQTYQPSTSNKKKPKGKIRIQNLKNICITLSLCSVNRSSDQRTRIGFLRPLQVSVLLDSISQSSILPLLKGLMFRRRRDTWQKKSKLDCCNSLDLHLYFIVSWLLLLKWLREKHKKERIIKIAKFLNICFNQLCFCGERSFNQRQ